MKTLVLLRHAKTEGQSLIKSDFDRQLTDVGKARQLKISEKLISLGVQPGIILCSPAKRTKETLDELLSATKWSAPVHFIDSLYHASASEILNTIKSFETDNSSLMVIGHNFGISNLANLLSQSGAEEMPTSGVHIITFESDIDLYQGILKHSLRPKNI
ncbi:MAG: histidine phosphatase family protein [Bacteroidetes bacterium]|nr:histidine phosphatase family protein [Bacteroidota bacterium]